MPASPEAQVRSFFRSVSSAAQELSQFLDRSVFVRSRGRNSSFENFRREFDQIMTPYLHQRTLLVYEMQVANREGRRSALRILNGIWDISSPQRSAINHLYNACWRMGFDLYGNSFISVRPDASSGAFARDPAQVQQIKADLQQAITAASRIGSGRTALNGLGALGMIQTDPTKMTPAEYAALLELQKKSQEIADSIEFKEPEPWTWENSSPLMKVIVVAGVGATVLALIAGRPKQ